MDAPKYVIFEACDLYILENEQLDDAKMLRLMRDESLGQVNHLKLPTHVMLDTDSLRVRI